MADIAGIGVAGHHPPPTYALLRPKHASGANAANPAQPGVIVDLRGVDLRGVDLSGVDLSGVHLSGHAPAATQDAKAANAEGPDQADAASPDNFVDVAAGFDKSLAAARFGQVIANRDAAAESAAALGSLSRALVSASYLGIAMPAALGPDAAPDASAPAAGSVRLTSVINGAPADGALADGALAGPPATSRAAAASARHIPAALHARKAAAERAPRGVDLLA